MPWDAQTIRNIYDRYEGCCAYCGKRLSIKNYGRGGERGAWQIDHRHSKANGGTDHGNNLAAACVACNAAKGRRNAKSYQRTVEVDEEGGGWVIAGLVALAGAALLGLRGGR